METQASIILKMTIAATILDTRDGEVAQLVSHQAFVDDVPELLVH